MQENMRGKKSFLEFYKQLNPDQKLAVDTIDGPVMVLAGPGTGKTQVLSLRIAQILQQTDTPASSILALTFTDAAASEMRSRLVSLIGSVGYSVTITTFHAFCTSLIKEYPEYFPIAQESEPVTELERSEILHRLFETMPLDILKPLNQPLLYVSAVMRAIGELKREGVSPADFATIVETAFAEVQTPSTKAEQIKFIRSRAKNQELLELYVAYENALREQQRYDYEDMILFVLRSFTDNPDFLSICQERFLYVLVDEYQDTNTAQNSLVEYLTSFWGADANVFVVGDPHQAIYRFQGASLENTYRFLELYPQARVVTLKIGYRCPQPIYDAAFSLTSHTRLPDSLPSLLHDGLTTKLLAETKLKTGASVVVAETSWMEHMALAGRVRSLLASGISSQEIVVLCRTNKEVFAVAESLLAQGIACTVSGGTSVLDKPHILGLIKLLQTIFELRGGEAGYDLFAVLGAAWLGISRVHLWTLGRQASKQGVSLFELIEESTELSSDDPIVRFVAKLKLWGVTEQQEPFPDWFTKILHESGYLVWLLEQPEKFTFLAEIQALTNTVKQLSYNDHSFGLEAFLRAVAIMQDRGIRLEAEYLQTNTDAIDVTTAHKAKGREWEYVFLTNCIDGVWGNVRKPSLLVLPEAVLQFSATDKHEQLAEDRRLFYVALTRAKKEFVASYSQTAIQSGRQKYLLPSQFFSEMISLSETKVSQEIDTFEQQQFLETSVMSQFTAKYSSSEREYIACLLTDFRLSVTALNKYLRDPKEFLEDVLLRLPQAKPAPMAFGSAVHKALEFVFRSILESDSLPSLSSAQQVFTRALERELLSKDELETRALYGKNLLEAYYQNAERFSAQPVFIERFFGSGFSTTMLDGIALSGRVDRVDWVDKSKNTVRVIDYKTGKQRSHNDIEGKTQAAELSEREQSLSESIRGPYKRQLLFYKLLADLDPTFHPKVTEGVFEFVEPHKTSGKIVSRSFELTDAAVADLSNLIKEVMREIRELTFLE